MALSLGSEWKVDHVEFNPDDKELHRVNLSVLHVDILLLYMIMDVKEYGDIYISSNMKLICMQDCHVPIVQNVMDHQKQKSLIGQVNDHASLFTLKYLSKTLGIKKRMRYYGLQQIRTVCYTMGPSLIFNISTNILFLI